MAERFLERIGIFKHQPTGEELDNANLRAKLLTADYLTGKIRLEEYKTELDKLPKIDLVRLASNLNPKT